MRVTDRMVFENAARNAGAARARAEAATETASTGLRVRHPEDDPAAAALIASHRASIDRSAALSKAMDFANDGVTTADGALNDVGNVLSRARELAVQLSNPTYSATERAAASTEVDGLFQQILGSLNAQSAGRYLFGGFQDAAPPFDAAGAYSGDTGVRQVEVAPGLRIDVSVRADVAIKGVGGGVDVLATLTALSAALSANNVAGIQGTLNGLDSGISQLAQARSELGGHQAVLDAASAATRSSQVSTEAALSHLADADAIDAATQLAQAEQALNAALTAAAKGFGPTLLDKL